MLFVLRFGSLTLNLAKKKGFTRDVFEYQMVKDELLPTKLADTKSLLPEPSLNVKKWGRELRESDSYCWNSNKYGKFKELDEGIENRKILNGTDNKAATVAKDNLFLIVKNLVEMKFTTGEKCISLQVKH